MKKIYETVNIDDLTPYDNNPRNNDAAVDAVAESIRQCGYIAPIVVDEDGVILAGHTRYKALRALEREQVDIIIVQGLNDDQKRKYRLLDNKTNELAGWDFEALEAELDGLDFEGFDFGFDMLPETEMDQQEDDNPYTTKVNIPQYEPTGETVNTKELADTGKYFDLIQEIHDSNVTAAEREFLSLAAARHIVFDYRKIAEYYANASEEMQRLMENSALVIIDVDDAIAKGYATLRKDIEELVFEGECND